MRRTLTYIDARLLDAIAKWIKLYPFNGKARVTEWFNVCFFKIAPQIQKGNEGFTHHMILFECDGSFTEELFDEGVDCSNQDNLPGIPYLKCRYNALVAGWAVGGEVKKNKPTIQ